jgi:carboxypeptidase family protein/TonB-dependent receptor-like protein
MVSFIPRTRVCALFALLAVVNVATGFSQVVTGTILGRITDSTAAVVPGATVQIQNVGTGFTQTAQTDSGGRYLVRSLPLGSYTVTVQQAGFQSQVRRGISLTVASEVTVNVELAVGNIQEKVEVTAEAPLVETTNATVSGLVSSEQMRDLPLNGRSIDSLTLLSPGVFVNRAFTPNAPIGQGLRISVNGGRPDANLFLLDGTVVNDHTTQGFGSATGASLGVEGILEFRVLTHNYSAEYGRVSGGVVSAVTRSGTNELHGSIYEFVRNNIFDARNFFNPGALPPFRRNQFGAAAGGRIIKDRMFFFANYEGLRRRKGNTVIASVPDANARQGLLPNPLTGQLQPVTVNPAALPYVNLYPQPNGRNHGDGTADNITNFSASGTEDYAMERMDFRLSDKDNFYWRYVFNPAQAVDPRPVPIFTLSSTSTNHFVVLSETHVFSGTSLNDFRFSFNRAVRGRDSLPLTTIPSSLSFVPGQVIGALRYQTGGSGTLQLSELGTDQGGANLYSQNLFDGTETFSTVRGAHSLKFGVELERSQLNMFVARSARGSYLFGGLTDLLAGRPNQFDLLIVDNESNPERGWRRILFSWFVQDDFRLRPNLTLNLGLRHEFLTAPTEVNGRTGNLRSPSDPKNTPGPPFIPPKLNFSPRVGMAWDPTGSGKTSVRLGAGVFYNQVVARTWIFDAFNNADYLKSFSLVNPPFPNAATSNFPQQLRATNSMPFHPNTPTSIHYNLEVQRQLAPTLSVRAGYIGASAYNNIRAVEANLAAPQILPDGSKFWPAGAPLTNPNFSRMSGSRSDSTSNYNGLQVSVLKSIAAGLQFQASYTYSKTLSDADEITSGQTNSTAPSALDPLDLSRDYSLSAYDQRHTLVLNGLYQMPWERRLSSKLVKATLGGWSINGIFTYGSGLPVDILAGFNNSRDRDANNPDRPNLAAGFSNNPIHGVTAGCQGVPAGQKLHTPDRWFDPCAFELSPAGTLGSLGRNTVTAPGFSDVDFTIVKATPLAETKKLEFRAEFFNLFNHANFLVPNMSVFSSSRARSGASGQITATSIDNRDIQLGLKLIF